MTARSTAQHRVLTNAETSTDDGVSTRFYNAAADNINNWWQYVGNYPRTWCWPVKAGATATEVVSPDGVIPTLILYLGRHYIDRAYTLARYYLQGKLFSVDPGGGGTTWTLYASTNLYVGDAEMDSDQLQAMTSAGVSITSTSWEVQTGTLSIPSRAYNGYLYFHLAAQNTLTNRSTLCSLTLQPGLS